MPRVNISTLFSIKLVNDLTIIRSVKDETFQVSIGKMIHFHRVFVKPIFRRALINRSVPKAIDQYYILFVRTSVSFNEVTTSRESKITQQYPVTFNCPSHTSTYVLNLKVNL